ncbi:hypothetical protein KIN20_001804 [Parelaphostrongylus tenuis]|uniref:Uncharacterized protein n=1 Tax=Parelaphostrongylus tenuis TaxID=148309 RepID=A0AAD5MDC8_PARTN|nr:hypothetical protein KIN20_001804 [Parelaphostrongylus tenuis]
MLGTDTLVDVGGVEDRLTVAGPDAVRRRHRRDECQLRPTGPAPSPEKQSPVDVARGPFSPLSVLRACGVDVCRLDDIYKLPDGPQWVSESRSPLPHGG